MVDIARHVMVLGARLVYGGDLREHGFKDLLFELVARHGRDSDTGEEHCRVTNYRALYYHHPC